jgi:hypothetical protein
VPGRWQSFLGRVNGFTGRYSSQPPAPVRPWWLARRQTSRRPKASHRCARTTERSEGVSHSPRSRYRLSTSDRFPPPPGAPVDRWAWHSLPGRNRASTLLQRFWQRQRKPDQAIFSNATLLATSLATHLAMTGLDDGAHGRSTDLISYLDATDRIHQHPRVVPADQLFARQRLQGRQTEPDPGPLPYRTANASQLVRLRGSDSAWELRVGELRIVLPFLSVRTRIPQRSRASRKCGITDRSETRERRHHGRARPH